MTIRPFAGTPDFDFVDMSNNDTTKDFQTKNQCITATDNHLATEGHNGTNRSARSLRLPCGVDRSLRVKLTNKLRRKKISVFTVSVAK
jgi:hypothetical protein